MADHPLLRPGDVNKSVPRAKKLIKRHLVAMGRRNLASKINNTTKYGPVAVEGTRLIQKKHGLVVDGVIGPKTWKVLEKVVVAPKPLVIRSRESWGAAPPKSRQKTNWTASTTSYLHHSVTKSPGPNATVEQEQAAMRQLQQIAFSRGFSDISYSYVVFQSGRVYEGRGFEVVGAHTYGHNNDVGICLCGDYSKDEVTAKQKQSVQLLRRKIGVLSGPLRAHCSVYATSCPGSKAKAAFGLSC